MIKLIESDKDDPGFVTLLEIMVMNLLKESAAEEVYVFQLNNWFDHKWLNYSGQGVLSGEENEQADQLKLTEFHKKRITIPAFNPKRIILQKYYHKNKDNSYQEAPLPREIHRKQRSQQNLHRPIADQSDSGIFIWYSANTITNQRGSLMVYLIQENQVETWYASFLVENKQWKIKQAKGKSLEAVEKLMVG
jgi:hypothetical protein